MERRRFATSIDLLPFRGVQRHQEFDLERAFTPPAGSVPLTVRDGGQIDRDEVSVPSRPVAHDTKRSNLEFDLERAFTPPAGSVPLTVRDGGQIDRDEVSVPS